MTLWVLAGEGVDIPFFSHSAQITVYLVFFACLNFREFLILELSRSLKFANFHFSSVALL